MKQRTILVLTVFLRHVLSRVELGMVSMKQVTVLWNDRHKGLSRGGSRERAYLKPPPPHPLSDEAFLVFTFIVYLHSLVTHPFLKEILYPPPPLRHRVI